MRPFVSSSGVQVGHNHSSRHPYARVHKDRVKHSPVARPDAGSNSTSVEASCLCQVPGVVFTAAPNCQGNACYAHFHTGIRQRRVSALVPLDASLALAGRVRVSEGGFLRFVEEFTRLCHTSISCLPGLPGRATQTFLSVSLVLLFSRCDEPLLAAPANRRLSSRIYIFFFANKPLSLTRYFCMIHRPIFFLLASSSFRFPVFFSPCPFPFVFRPYIFFL